MKTLFLAMALCLCLTLSAQDTDYIMFQTIELTPKDGMVKQLNEGIKAHNAKYHKEGDQSAQVWQISSGPNSGKLLWVMGPVTWATFDKEMTDAHLDDWMKNVGANSNMGAWNYWRLLDGMAYSPEDFKASMMLVRYFGINEQKGDNARKHFKQVVDLYAAEKFGSALFVFSNQAQMGTDPDWAIMWQYENWAALDNDDEFWEKYEAKYGDNMEEFFENWNEFTEWKGMEFQTYLPDLSSN